MFSYTSRFSFCCYRCRYCCCCWVRINHRYEFFFSQSRSQNSFISVHRTKRISILAYARFYRPKGRIEGFQGFIHKDRLSFIERPHVFLLFFFCFFNSKQFFFFLQIVKLRARGTVLRFVKKRKEKE